MLIKCPECGIDLTDEMIEANMCWECGKILDESLLDEETLENIHNQAKQNQSEQYLEPDTVDSKMKELIQKHMITTGFNFEGYSIKKYITVVQSEVVLGTGFLSEFSANASDIFGIASATVEDKLSEAKYRAQRQLIKRSIKTGGNALIGINFNIATLRSNMLVISAMGTSVVVDKIAGISINERNIIYSSIG